MSSRQSKESAQTGSVLSFQEIDLSELEQAQLPEWRERLKTFTRIRKRVRALPQRSRLVLAFGLLGSACSPPVSGSLRGEEFEQVSEALLGRRSSHGRHSSRSHHNRRPREHAAKLNVQLGPRPYFLVNDMDESPLKDELLACSEKAPKPSDFSIGHRGAALQFPEHTAESYEAAARMGAGIIECDVTFTLDRELVCRHSQCDLHTTTNILATDLAEKCTQNFVPADAESGTPASAKCCTSDITLDEFKSLCGKMDAADLSATTVEAYLGGTPDFRTDLYSACGTLLTHAESIELIGGLGAKFTPELKSPSVEMPFEGEYTQQEYASQMLHEYRKAGVSPRKVWAQSFDIQDIQFWVKEFPAFGRQAVFLDGRYESASFDFRSPETWSPSMEELKADGVRILAPPTWMLVDLDEEGRIVPSLYAVSAKAEGLDLLTWTLERSGFLATGGGFYYQSIASAIDNDGDVFQLLDVLARDVGVKGVFSDWPATVTHYANCFDL